jgi:hypothetical protein
MRALLILFAFLLSGNTTFAQSTEMWFAFPIVSVENKGANKYLVTINYGTEAGIQKGSNGEVWAILQQQRKGEAHYVNSITIQEATTKMANALLETKEQVYKGDLLFARIPVNLKFKSSYFYLASYGIFFTDENRKALLHHRRNPENGWLSVAHREICEAMQMALNEAGQTTESKPTIRVV